MAKMQPNDYDIDKKPLDVIGNIIQFAISILLIIIAMIVFYFAVYGVILTQQVEYWEKAHKANFLATMHKYNKFQACLDNGQDSCLCAYNLPEYERKCYCDEQETN